MNILYSLPWCKKFLRDFSAISLGFLLNLSMVEKILEISPSCLQRQIFFFIGGKLGKNLRAEMMPSKFRRFFRLFSTMGQFGIKSERNPDKGGESRRNICGRNNHEINS